MVTSRDAVLAELSRHRAEMERRFGVQSLTLFGSVARDEAHPASDVDLLVAFREPPGFDGYMALKWYVEELLGRRVDKVPALLAQLERIEHDTR